MTLNTYLFFDGNCAEAFDLYGRVFAAEPRMRMTYADAPTETGVGEADRDKLMHVSLPVGGSVLMGSDHVAGRGEPPRPSNSFAVCYDAPSREDADAKFAALQQGGGGAAMPMQDTFWGAYFGMLKDRFGVHWMINHDPRRPTAGD